MIQICRMTDRCQHLFCLENPRVQARPWKFFIKSLTSSLCRCHSREQHSQQTPSLPLLENKSLSQFSLQGFFSSHCHLQPIPAFHIPLWPTDQQLWTSLPLQWSVNLSWQSIKFCTNSWTCVFPLTLSAFSRYSKWTHLWKALILLC